MSSASPPPASPPIVPRRAGGNAPPPPRPAPRPVANAPVEHSAQRGDLENGSQNEVSPKRPPLPPSRSGSISHLPPVVPPRTLSIELTEHEISVGFAAVESGGGGREGPPVPTRISTTRPIAPLNSNPPQQQQAPPPPLPRRPLDEPGSPTSPAGVEQPLVGIIPRSPRARKALPVGQTPPRTSPDSAISPRTPPNIRERALSPGQPKVPERVVLPGTQPTPERAFSPGAQPTLPERAFSPGAQPTLPERAFSPGAQSTPEGAFSPGSQPTLPERAFSPGSQPTPPALSPRATPPNPAERPVFSKAATIAATKRGPAPPPPGPPGYSADTFTPHQTTPLSSTGAFFHTTTTTTGSFAPDPARVLSKSGSSSVLMKSSMKKDLSETDPEFDMDYGPMRFRNPEEAEYDGRSKSGGAIRKFGVGRRQSAQASSGSLAPRFQNTRTTLGLSKTDLNKKGAGFLTLNKKKAKKPGLEELIVSTPSSFRDGGEGGGSETDLTKTNVDAFQAIKATSGKKEGNITVKLGDGLDEVAELRMALLSLMELVSTEKDYVMDMVLLVTHYRNPCLSNRYLPDEQASTIFMNVDSLMELHTHLVERFGDDPTLLSVVTAYEEECPKFIKEYGLFASQYSKAISTLESPKLSKEFGAFCDRARQSSVNKGLALTDFLIKPIQRICKYPLLFRELIKNLPSDHPLTPSCKSVQAAMDLVAGRVNEAKQKAECDVKLQLLEEQIEGLGSLKLYGARNYEYEANFLVYGTSHKRLIFLLSDYFLVCQRHKLQSGKYILKHAINLADQGTYVDLLVAPKTEEGEKKSVLKISSLEELRYYFFEFVSDKESLDWASKMVEMKNKYKWIKNYKEHPFNEEELERKVILEKSKTQSQEVPATTTVAFRDEKTNMELQISKRQWNNLDLQDESLQGVTYVIGEQPPAAPDKKKKEKKKMRFGKKKKDEISIGTPAHK